MTIGEVADLAGVATSAVRYYERQGLIEPDGRESGQRRYRTGSLRRLVFIGMLKDAGLTLDDIRDVLHADTVDKWKAVAAERLADLDAELERLQHARSLLHAALLCRFDHPLTDCRVMGGEIDRRISEAE